MKAYDAIAVIDEPSVVAIHRVTKQTVLARLIRFFDRYSGLS